MNENKFHYRLLDRLYQLGYVGLPTDVILHNRTNYVSALMPIGICWAPTCHSLPATIVIHDIIGH
jgi:hypothetical protein